MSRHLKFAITLLALHGWTDAYADARNVPATLPQTKEAATSADRPFKWQGSGGWGMGCGYCQGFNLKNRTSLTGTVEKVEMMTPARGMHQGVHLLLKTDKETISVHLGPSWYIENQDVTINPKDKVKVNGVHTQWNGAPAIIAFDIEKDGKVLSLRDNQGRPVWSGWRGGPMRGRMQ